MNVAHVDDLAEGHLLALEKGSQGRSYICGGENLTMAEMLGILSEVSGLPAADRHFPSVFPMVAGVLSQFVEGELLGREPRVPLEAAQMASTPMIFDDSRARIELGYTSRKPALALYDAAKWFVDRGYVSEERAGQIGWSPPGT
jgi:dihydroflavonol-4-reductase